MPPTVGRALQCDRATPHPGHGAALFNAHLPAFQTKAASPLPPRHEAGFPDLGLLRRFRPTRGPKADSEPARQWRAAPGWLPRSSPIDRRGRHPAFPLPPRDEYAADLPHGLRASHLVPAPELPPHQGHRALPLVSAHTPQVGADAALKGVRPLVRSRYTFPSRLPGPSRLAVSARPVVVGAAPTEVLGSCHLRDATRGAKPVSRPRARARRGQTFFQ
jgi:hypothetical protein